MKHWAFDTEDNSEGITKIINFFNGVSHYTFTFDEVRRKNKKLSDKEVSKQVRKQAIEFLLNLESTKQTVWATNLQYDLVNLFGDHLEVLEIGYVGSRIISARISGTQFKFFDTLNHWKMSVKKMGERIGLEKLETDDFNNVEYCKRDTEIVWHFVDKMNEVYLDIDCELKATIGSTSLNYFQKHFYQRPKERIFKDKDLEFMKGGYYGGRTEIFFNRPITGKIHYFDFNSLYPSVMRENFPVLVKDGFHYTKNPNFDECEGIADVRFSVDYIPVPYLAYRCGDTGRLLFPCGRFRGRYTYFEIRRALALGYRLEKVYKAIEFTAGKFKPFLEFVNLMYARRLEATMKGDELMRMAFKDLPNNLYGKFAQGKDFTKLVPHHGHLKPGDVVLGPLVVRESRGPYPEHTNYIWAAYTTAYGRDKLWRAMNEITEKKGLLIYCDTDSVIFEGENQIFEDSSSLGELKLEKPEGSKYPFFGYAHFKMPKLYTLQTVEGISTYKARGIPKESAKQFFETGLAKFRKPLKLRETLRRNMSPKRTFKLIPNFWGEIEKQSRKSYDKRVVNSDGTTQPLIIGG